MAFSICSYQVADLHLHLELDGLIKEAETLFGDLHTPLDGVMPVVDHVIPIMPNRTVIGNWPAFRHAQAVGATEVPVQIHTRLALEDPVLVTLRALTSLVHTGYDDPLLLGLIYRHWREYETREVPLRPDRSQRDFERTQFGGLTRRQYFHKELCRRTHRSLRELQRYSLILDAPRDWLRLQRQGQISIAVLERIQALKPAALAALSSEYEQGVELEQLLGKFDLKPNRSGQRRLEKAIRIVMESPVEAMALLTSWEAQKTLEISLA